MPRDMSSPAAAGLSQAVILAGGRGARLIPLTDNCPKPMLRFHGRPFLEYLIEMLREQGISHVLILAGYLGETISDYFGDGRRFGIDIEYSRTPAENETGTRLRLAREQLAPEFLLLYGDNYWPLRLDALRQAWVAAGTPAQLVVYRNRDGYSRDNVRIAADGRIERYDPARRASGLSGVEIGFALLRRKLLDFLPEGNVSLEGELYPRLIERGALAAFLTEHRYYTIGSFDRLAAAEQFLARRPTVLLDRDGVLNRRPGPAQYVTREEEWEWVPRARTALRLLHEAGVRCLVVTNQPGVARGALSDKSLARIHRRMCGEAEAAGGRIERVYCCPHDWNAGCECRKPRPGLLFQAQRDWHLDLTRTWFAGDDDRDEAAAQAAGANFARVTEAQGLLSVVRERVLPELMLPELACPSAF